MRPLLGVLLLCGLLRAEEDHLAVARRYLAGAEVPRSEKRALAALGKAAEAGRIAGVAEIARQCRSGNGLPRDCGLVVRVLRVLKAHDEDASRAVWREILADAKTGDPGAWTVVGHVASATEVHETALLYFWAAADRGHPEASYSLAVAFAGGHGTPEDPKEGLRWMRKAADDGHADAQSMLGHWYLAGRHVEKDPQQGFAWLEKAAAQGDGIARSSAAMCLIAGAGVAKDPERAVALLRLAVQQDFDTAKYMLGVQMVKGEGTARDEVGGWALIGEAAAAGVERALNNIEVRAKEGRAPALFQLGLLQVEGKGGVERDEKAGTASIRQAAEKGYAPAKAWLAEQGK